MARVNPDAIIGWAIATGRLAWQKEQATREAFDRDAVRTLGRLLLAKPAPGKDQACPLFTKNATTSAAAHRTWAERKAREQAAAHTVTTAISSTLQALGHDPEDPAMRALVKRELEAAETARKNAARTAARAADAERHRLERRADFGAQLAAGWQ